MIKGQFLCVCVHDVPCEQPYGDVMIIKAVMVADGLHINRVQQIAKEVLGYVGNEILAYSILCGIHCILSGIVFTVLSFISLLIYK